MNARQREARDQKIVSLFEAGMRPAIIANRVSIAADRVRTILRKHGCDLNDGQGWVRGGGGTVWDLPPSQLREHFINRQRQGARERLAEIEASQ